MAGPTKLGPSRDHPWRRRARQEIAVQIDPARKAHAKGRPNVAPDRPEYVRSGAFVYRKHPV